MDAGSVIGWDFGGAHLKAAHVVKREGAPPRVTAVLQLPCPLWRGLEHLERAVGEALAKLRPAPRHSITMSGEMADLFRSRGEGVRRLIGTAVSMFAGSQILVFAGRAGLVAPVKALELPDTVASANWLASAALAAASVDQGLFVDIGTTTTDIAPLREGKVEAVGESDADRLASQELVYTGIARTPVMAVATCVPFEGRHQGVMAEIFATMADVHRLHGTLPEEADQFPPADGGGKTIEDSARRLARMLGRDVESAGLDAWRRLAGHLVDLQRERIAGACAHSLARGLLNARAPLIGAGCGRFMVAELARRFGRDYVDFAALVDSDSGTSGWVGTCAPAVAVACLAARL